MQTKRFIAVKYKDIAIEYVDTLHRPFEDNGFGFTIGNEPKEYHLYEDLLGQCDLISEIPTMIEEAKQHLCELLSET